MKRVITQIRKLGIVRPKDAEGLGISRSAFYRLVGAGHLARVGPGLYSANSDDPAVNISIIEASALIPGGVICLLSALAFHELTTQNPFEVWMAVERKAWVPSKRRLPVRMFYFTGGAFYDGIDEHKLDGTVLRVYNPAKTVADCFKYRNKIGIDVAIEALRDVWRQRKATMDDLWHYARVCRVANVMRPYMESLI